MYFERLSVQGLRCLESVSVTPGPGLNLFVGGNGAGKTSLLEAAYLLSYGRSFRAGPRDALIRRGSDELQVYGEIRSGGRQLYRLGLGRSAGTWRIRINDASADRISDLIRYCAVVCFEPGSHALIAGAADERRRFLDWGVFHVEHGFLSTWQRYRRALKQRNTLLRAPDAPGDALFVPWEQEMDATAREVDTLRRHYLSLLEPELRVVCDRLLPELGDLNMHYRPGWNHPEALCRSLATQRDRDRVRGHTTLGIHRADWRITFSGAPRREHFSRGQEKLCALACILAQAQVYAHGHDEWPVVCLDDLASELDAEHQAATVGLLRDARAQVLMTGTALDLGLPPRETRVFHVEHGVVTGNDACAAKAVKS